MNHGFDVHIANNIMKQRFIKKRDFDEFTVMSSNEFLSIKTYDTMIIKVNTSTEKNTMILLNVIYISDFMVNVVAESILDDKRFHFDTQHRHLHRNDFFIVLVLRIDAHYVLKDNRKLKGMFTTFIRVDSTHD